MTQIIAFCGGNPGVGKSLAADKVATGLSRRYGKSILITSFAKALREMAYARVVEYQRGCNNPFRVPFTEAEIRRCLTEWKDVETPNNLFPGCRTGRDVLLKIGEDERAKEPAVWVNHVALEDRSTKADFMLIDDLRKRSEYEWIKAAGGIVVWVDRPMFTGRDGTDSEITPAQCDLSTTASDTENILHILSEGKRHAH